MSHLYAWTPHITSEALRIVRNVLKSKGGPVSTQDIYKLAVAQKPEIPVDPPPPIIVFRRDGSSKQLSYPPHPQHPIRSLRYLKTIVLPAMEHSCEIEKFHIKATLSPEEIAARLAHLNKNARQLKEKSLMGTLQDVWLWRFRETPPTPEKKEELEELYGQEVGVGKNTSHLNRRRKKARVKKVENAVKFMRLVQKARREGEREKEREKKVLDVPKSMARLSRASERQPEQS